MTERIEATLSVPAGRAGSLEAALAAVEQAAGGITLTVTPAGPAQAHLALEATDEAGLADAVKRIGPALAALHGVAQVHVVAFSDGVGVAMRARLGGLAERVAAL